MIPLVFVEHALTNGLGTVTSHSSVVPSNFDVGLATP